MNRATLFLLLLFFSACKVSSHPDKTRDSSWASGIIITSLHNLYKLNDSIYRSEQPDADAFHYLSSIGIKTVLDLRDSHSDTPFFKANSFTYFNVPIITRNFNDSEVVQSLRIIKNSPKPILVHCKRGSDRTGLVVAMYRIIFENWSKEKALEEMKNGGYGFHTRFHNIPAYIEKVNIAAIKQML